MPGPMPNADAERRRRNAPTFAWVDLPAAGRTKRAPALPPLRKWRAETRKAWEYWWSTPQATAWDQSGHTLHRWAILFDELVTGEGTAATHAQMTALEDRHGFTPASMLKLRWRIVEDPATQAAGSSQGASGKGRSRKKVDPPNPRRDRALQLLPGGGNAS